MRTHNIQRRSPIPFRDTKCDRAGPLPARAKTLAQRTRHVGLARNRCRARRAHDDQSHLCERQHCHSQSRTWQHEGCRVSLNLGTQQGAVARQRGIQIMHAHCNPGHTGHAVGMHADIPLRHAQPARRDITAQKWKVGCCVANSLRICCERTALADAHVPLFKASFKKAVFDFFDAHPKP